MSLVTVTGHCNTVIDGLGLDKLVTVAGVSLVTETGVTVSGKGGIFDAGVRAILRTPLLKTQICTLIHETQRHIGAVDFITNLLDDDVTAC